jgi:hypothetical protein
MRKNNFFISFGIWLAVLPFLGIPGTWKSALVSLSGIFLALVFLGPTILKKLQVKPIRRPTERKKQEPPKQELKFSSNNNIAQDINQEPPISQT